jgi:hypothetical protein
MIDLKPLYKMRRQTVLRFAGFTAMNGIKRVAIPTLRRI